MSYRTARAIPIAFAAALSLALASPVRAGEGHDHGDAGPSASSNGPSRLPNGNVFLPKPAQRQLTVRTVVVEERDLARTVELSGRVSADPNAGGKVQATSSGRLEAGPRGLPSIGQTVRRGDVIGHVTASVSPIERSTQAAQLAELRAAEQLATRRLARLRELSDTVPRKEIEAGESELSSLSARARAIGGGVSGREALVAPVSGVIATANAVAGQVVDAREVLFEIVDPQRLRIEALSFDAALASNIGSATLALGQQRVPLVFVGASPSLREQAQPLAFRAQGPALSALAVGQPVKVFIQTKETVKAIAVPLASLMKNPANQTIVWVKAEPERFEARTVTVEPLDGVNVAVTSGLKAGDRVATQGATLINQVR